MSRFKYEEEMGFFKIKDKLGIIPTFFVDNKQIADKFRKIFNTLNPKINGTEIILEWKTGFNSTVFLNTNKMDKVEVKIEEEEYGNRKDIIITHHSNINLERFAEKSTKDEVLEQLRTIPCINQFLENHSFIANRSFILIQGLQLREEEKEEIEKEIHECFPSVKCQFLEGFSDVTYDLIIDF